MTPRHRKEILTPAQKAGLAILAGTVAVIGASEIADHLPLDRSEAPQAPDHD